MFRMLLSPCDLPQYELFGEFSGILMRLSEPYPPAYSHALSVWIVKTNSPNVSNAEYHRKSLPDVFVRGGRDIYRCPSQADCTLSSR